MRAPILEPKQAIASRCVRTKVLAVCLLFLPIATLLVSEAPRAEMLFLSNAVPDPTPIAGRFVAQCKYTKTGRPADTSGVSAEFFVGREKTLTERLFATRQANSDAQAMCPPSVQTFPDQPPRVATYSDCILKHMEGVTSDAATYAVKESCMRSLESVLPLAALPFLSHSNAIFWKSPFLGEPGYGLFITVNNLSYYSITGLQIAIETKTGKVIEDYNVRRFFEASPGSQIVGLPKDPSIEYFVGPGLHTFYVPIRQIANPPDTWNQLYRWSIVGAMGFVD